MKIKVKCPYCGFEQPIYVEWGDHQESGLRFCDIDEGGCDKQMAFRVSSFVQEEVGVATKTMIAEVAALPWAEADNQGERDDRGHQDQGRTA